jgi:4-hydroxy-3-polyprenylbenzoate decarboxylase
VTDVDHRPIIVGISGASGVILGITALRLLRAAGVATHLVMTRAARLTLAQETDLKVDDVHALADYHYDPYEIGAAMASGSFRTRGMLVAPCSVKTLAQIAMGLGESLLPRAADVTLKERRRLVLMVRETPLNLTHIRNMATVTENGGVIAPPVPAFYARCRDIGELVNQSVGRVLDLFGIEGADTYRWADPASRGGDGRVPQPA